MLPKLQKFTFRHSSNNKNNNFPQKAYKDNGLHIPEWTIKFKEMNPFTTDKSSCSSYKIDGSKWNSHASILKSRQARIESLKTKIPSFNLNSTSSKLHSTFRVQQEHSIKTQIFTEFQKTSLNFLL